MSTRVDGFIIWNHGVKHIDGIMDILRRRLDIICLKRTVINDMEAFIKAVYSIDTYPIEHLRAKTRYLTDHPGETIFVLAKNHHVDEQMVGKGKFRALQCQYVQKVKFEIRNKYNPEPNHHVIHGTDVEKETRHLLKLFGMKPLGYYLRNEGTVFPYHIDPFDYEEIELPLAELKANINGRYIPIKDTPHYAYVNGNKKVYQEYFYPKMGKGLNEDHFPGAFDNLLEVENFNPILVNGCKILDGVHRASIELARGKKIIKAYDKL